MPKIVLTKAFIEQAACEPGKAKIDYFDLDQRGFMLEVRRSGGKTFYQRYTDERGRERYTRSVPQTPCRSTRLARRPASSLLRLCSAPTRRRAGANCAKFRPSPSSYATATCRM
jgi:hypothetical protein